jgi:prophage regulatory protein
MRFMFHARQGGANMATAILRLPVVKARTGLSRSTIYVRASTGTFPKPVSLGGRAVGWVESEIQQWLEQRIEQSRKAAA